MANAFAVVTGASTGIGFELARIAVNSGYDVLLVADEPFVEAAADNLLRDDRDVTWLQTDLATFEGVDRLLEALRNRKIDVLCANAGRGLGRCFLDQEPADWRHVIDTNVTGTVYLLQNILRQMIKEGNGRVLVTGSIAGFIPGSFQAVYNGTKAFIDSFTDAIRNELKEFDRVTITTLLPGPTDTAFFERADMMDTKVGVDPDKADAEKVARDGWDAMLKGKGNIVSGWKNKLQAAAAHVTPTSVMAEQHRRMAEPGTANS